MGIPAAQVQEIRDLLNETVSNKLETYGRNKTSIPFLNNLIQDKRKLNSYAFVHSMVTSLGMSFYEQVSEIIAAPKADYVERKSKFPIVGTSVNQRTCINRIIDDLQAKRRAPNTRREINEVLSQPSTQLDRQVYRREVDFYMRRGRKEYFIEIKSPRPNKEEIRAVKEKLLEWAARRKAAGRTGRTTNVICGFTYNPWHPREYQHFSGMHIMHRGGDLLIGREYWNFLGGRGTYKKLLDIFEDAGRQFASPFERKIRQLSR